MRRGGREEEKRGRWKGRRGSSTKTKVIRNEVIAMETSDLDQYPRTISAKMLKQTYLTLLQIERSSTNEF